MGTTKELEMEILSNYDWLEFYPLSLRGLKRGFGWGSLLRNAVVLLELLVALPKTLYIIGKIRPSIILGTGGYSSFPPLFWGTILRIPTFILEPNAVPGLTNRLLAPWVDLVFLAFESAKKYLHGHKILVTGVPIRENLLQTKSCEGAYQLFDLEPNRRTVLVMGGSSGSILLNQAVLRDRKRINKLEDVQILLVTGRGEESKSFKRILIQEGIENIKVCDYIEDMGRALKMADLVICRAGACTLAEITALGLPSILVPWKGAVCDHQSINASILKKKGACLVIEEENLSKGKESIATLIKRVLLNEDLCERMRSKSYSLGKRKAAKQIKKEVEAFINVSQ